MVDLDDFKLVNDTFGHQLGDRVLVHSAEMIRSTLRLSDVAARYGGDEFAVILPDTDRGAAVLVANRIVAAFAETAFQTDGRGPIPVGATVGVAVHPDDGRGGPQLIAADSDLYRAKAGRDRVADEVVPGPSVVTRRRPRRPVGAARYGSTSQS
jgi:diguanylate cyclase (GGDEF)-like protein